MGILHTENSLNLVYGEFSGLMLRQAVGDGTPYAIHRDLLISGKVSDIIEWESWERDRSNHWQTLMGMGHVSPFDHKDDLYRAFDRMRNAKYIILWCGSGLADQLFKVFVVRLFKYLDIDLSKLHLREYAQYSISLVNDLRADDVALMRRLTNDEIKEIDHVWAAFTSQTPHELAIYLASTRTVSHNLKIAMHHMIKHFPSHHTGLNFWQSKILEFSERQTTAASICSKTLAYLIDNFDFMHEVVVMNFIREMVNGLPTKHLLNADSDPILTRDSLISLGVAGQRILTNGKRDMEALSINRWVGGILLKSPNNIWYADSEFSNILV